MAGRKTSPAVGYYFMYRSRILLCTYAIVYTILMTHILCTHAIVYTILMDARTVCLAITMLQYYICLGVVLTVILVLGLGLGFGIILYFVIGTCSNGPRRCGFHVA